MRKIKSTIKSRWLSKYLPVALACMSLVGYHTSAFAENLEQDRASNNRVEINDEDYEVAYGGGNEESSEPASGNKITVNDGNIGAVLGGVSASGDVKGNQIIIEDGEIRGVSGGISVVNHDLLNKAGNVSGNRVIIHGGTIQFVSGGEVAYTYLRDAGSDFDSSFSELCSADVFNNVVEIRDGSINGAVAGGIALTGSARNNYVEISKYRRRMGAQSDRYIIRFR